MKDNRTKKAEKGNLCQIIRFELLSLFILALSSLFLEVNINSSNEIFIIRIDNKRAELLHGCNEHSAIIKSVFMNHY